MRGVHCTRRIWSPLVLSLWLSSFPQVWAQQIIGKADGIDGTALRDAAPLVLLDELALTNKLRTEQRSKLDVLITRAGSKFALGAEVEAILDRVSDGGKTVHLRLISNGTLRVVTSPPPGATIVTRTPTGLTADAHTTMYIVSCGPPRFPPDRCRFVSVFGTTEVRDPAGALLSTLGPGQTVDVQGVSIVPPGVRLISASELQDLLTETTVVGTGTWPDRLDVAGPIERPPFDPRFVDPPPPGPPHLGPPPPPDNPPPVFQLPRPPQPPPFP